MAFGRNTTEGRERWTVRRQVPESDPVYQNERERWKNVSGEEVFASGSLDLYDANMQARDRALAKNRDLEAELEKIEDKKSMRAQYLVEAIQQNSGFAEKMVKERARFLRNSFEDLADDLGELLIQDGYEDRKKFVMSEVRKMFGAPEVQEQLKRHFGDDLSAFTATDLFIKVDSGEISDEFLYAVAKQHVENIREQEAQLKKIVEETKTEFKTAVTEAVAKGFLPETAERALHRMDSVVVVLSDRLLAVKSSKLGEANASGRIRVSNEQLQPHLIPRLKKTIIHEFLHELSGKSVTVRTVRTVIGDHQEPLQLVSHRKTGVALSAPDLLYSPNRWLNEAITEWLAVKLSGYEGDTGEFAYGGSFSYTLERAELDRLLAAGLEESLVTNAYFENISSDQPKGERGQHFAKLVQRINALEGQAGFTKLENKHIMHEVEYQLYSRYVHAAEHMTLDISTLPPETRVFYITMRVGTSERTAVTKKFVYIAKPMMVEGITTSVADRWKRVKDTLSYIEAAYGSKATYSVVEE